MRPKAHFLLDALEPYISAELEARNLDPRFYFALMNGIGLGCGLGEIGDFRTNPERLRDHASVLCEALRLDLEENGFILRN